MGYQMISQAQHMQLATLHADQPRLAIRILARPAEAMLDLQLRARPLGPRPAGLDPCATDRDPSDLGGTSGSSAPAWSRRGGGESGPAVLHLAWLGRRTSPRRAGGTSFVQDQRRLLVYATAGRAGAARVTRREVVIFAR